MDFKVEAMISLFPILFKALGLTLKITFISTFISVLLGILIAVIRFFKVKVLYEITGLFVSFFRGTPLLVQLFLIYYGLPQVFPIFINMSAFTATVLGLSLHFSAYMAETIRGALSSVDRGQLEAGYSVGMNTLQVMIRVVIPQGIRVAIPSIVNISIDLLKSSSLAFTLGLADIMAKTQLEAASSYRFLESYLAVALVYWGLVILLERIQKTLEIKLNRAY
ncbi:MULTISPECIES: amino acid ABC transporter permease [Psychrilyobacter]|uniref:ABC transporter permease subunit n=1 Tax=Psychrilyobacter piezotolerans TaxID=2293438 RepID=A0ABX9KGR3_9FUSO|nr:MULTISPECIES: amino acid ABC transporter permease [Psychrilyobacter]MCS5422734.1 amino acid ABC transporter permease [Psychrilyobacter sp. S5]NDI77984.1 amino acid ABC transporter permease [Psychrilyobacter piezotolerans]RDE61927.1 amino acid ABC transporter permease [Psychrilyobacter sp. S5]REI41153.1 ABC transporter permease subunit [Psychrilyobacter piezotolerans]